MTATEAEVEAAARAIAHWRGIEVDDEAARDATAALAAVEPLIRGRLAQEILSKEPNGPRAKYRLGLRHAARIVRGDAS